MSGGHQEQEQTLNQILTEMDGFTTDTNVIVLASTNRPDTLDPALLRSGRFDRKVLVNIPSKEERKLMFEYYLNKKKLDKKINVDSIVNRSSGMAGADIENIVNEAALKVARDNGKKITDADLNYAIEKVVM
jgi:cell division protease FtsH